MSLLFNVALWPCLLGSAPCSLHYLVVFCSFFPAASLFAKPEKLLGVSAEGSSPNPRFFIESGAIRFLLFISCRPIAQMPEYTIPLHPALEIALAQLATLVFVDSSFAAQAFQVHLHYRLAFGFVVERKRSPFWRYWFRGDLASARASKGRHDANDVYKVERRRSNVCIES